MSVDKARDEGVRWLDTALDDAQTARILRDNGKFAQCCFYCQQAAEKAVKAVYYCADQEPWGHSIFKLVTQLGDEGIAVPELNGRIDSAKQLDQYYIPTRYPNGLPGTTPAETYSISDAETALKAAGVIIAIVQAHFGDR